MSSINQLTEIPSELKALPNWVSWKLTEKGKEPFIAGTNKHAKVNDSSTWTAFEPAVASTKINGAEGVGFVIGGQAVEEEIVGYDVDGCRNPKTGELTPWAMQLLNATSSYSETTPSGFGIRIWVKGKLPNSEHVFDLDPAAGFGGKVKIEVYDNSRFYTCTGDSVYQESVGIRTCDLNVVYELIREIQTKYPAPSKTKNTHGNGVSTSMPVRIQRSGTALTNKYELLMRGTVSGDKPMTVSDNFGNSLTYDDRSAADMALATVSARKHGNNPDAIWNDYVESSLYREEWGKREADFRRLTIAKAIVSAEKTKDEPSKTNANPGTTEPPRPFVMVRGDSFMLEKIAPRKVLMRTKTRGEAIFYAKSINQVFAWRGNGKTCLGLGLTAAFATGGSFLNFESPVPVNVLYIEGELPEEQMQERWKQIIGNTGGRARLVTIDKQPEHTFPSFASTEGMARVEATLAQCESEGFSVDVLFLDSVSTLFNIAANDEENWINIQTWLLRLRSQGLCIFFFHHAGKSGMSRSHSKSEDMLDVSIKLDTPDDKEEGVLHAILEFDKARHGISEPRAAIKMRPMHSPACACNATKGKLVGCRGDSVSWEHEILTDLKKAQAFEMFVRGVSVRKAAQDLGVNKSKVGRWREEYGRGVINAIDLSVVKEKE
jgi:hypothetical protein